LGESATFRSGRSGGIKPLNAPRALYVRTDSAGTPVAAQVPPAIKSPRARASAALAHKARDLRRSTTPAENLLWKHLRKTHVKKYKFTRQYPIGSYIADFCCRRARLVVELDGGQHATQQEADADRQRYLEALGYRVIRFWNKEVFENLEGVLFRIVEALEGADVPLAANGIHPHPNPLPAREREQDLPPTSGGRWVRVVEVKDLWKVNDEWWRGPEEEIARLYYTVRLENSQQLTVYLDLVANSWYRQAG